MEKDEVKDGFPHFVSLFFIKKGTKTRCKVPLEVNGKRVSELSECVSTTFQLRRKRRKADKLLIEFNFGVSTAIRLPLFLSKWRHLVAAK